MSTPQLPDELWLRITDFLGEESDYLRKVWRFTSLFLHRYLDVKYHSVDLFPENLDPGRFLSYLQHLLEPYIKGRIRRLNITRPASSYTEILQQMESKTSVLSGILSLARPRKQTLEDRENVASLASRLVINLPNLHSLSVSDKVGALPRPLSSLIRLLWTHQTRTLGPDKMTIRHLFLDVFPRNLDEMFLVTKRSTSICMTRLRTLNMSFRSVDTKGRHAVAAFFRALANPQTDGTRRPSLNSLSLHFYKEEVHAILFRQIFPILCPKKLITRYARILQSGIDIPDNLPEPTPLLPQLTHFSLFLTGPTEGYILSALKFLAAQGSTITHIRLPPHRLSYNIEDVQLNPGLSDWSWQLAPSLPMLEHLEMEGLGQYSLVGTGAICSYLVRSKPENLKTILLDDPKYPLSYLELDDLLCHFKQYDMTNPNKVAYSGALSRIERISLHILTLTPNHLYLMSAALPKLRVLQLRIFAVGSAGFGEDQFPLRGKQAVGSIPIEPYIERKYPEAAVIRSHNTGNYWNRLEEGETIEETFFVDLTLFTRQGLFDTWNQGSDLQEMKISLQDVDERVVNRLRDALKECFPCVRHFVVGNGTVLTDSKFDVA